MVAGVVSSVHQEELVSQPRGLGGFCVILACSTD